MRIFIVYKTHLILPSDIAFTIELTQHRNMWHFIDLEPRTGILFYFLVFEYLLIYLFSNFSNIFILCELRVTRYRRWNRYFNLGCFQKKSCLFFRLSFFIFRYYSFILFYLFIFGSWESFCLFKSTIAFILLLQSLSDKFKWELYN